MRVLCIIDCLGSGGSQRQLMEIAAGLIQKGCDVSMLVYYDSVFYNDELDRYRIPCHRINEKNLIKRIRAVRRFIVDGKFTGVISFLEGPNLIAELAGFPYRRWRLLTGERSANPAITKSPKKIFFRFFHLFTDYIISNSKTTLSILRHILPFIDRSRFRVIYNIVDTDKWVPLRGFIPLRNGRLKLVVAASHQYLKNLDGLIEALNILPNEERKKISVEWYGDRLEKPYYSESYPMALKKIKTYGLDGIIKFFPATPDLYCKLAEADAAGLFSFYEGLPNFICEAMACGKAVLAPAVSDIPLLLSSEPGLLFNPADTGSVARALLFLLHMTPDQLLSNGIENRRIAMRMFNREILTGKYLELLT